MPSHIFARLGLWQEDIDSNLASLRASQNASAVHVGPENQLHAMEFLEYAYLQIGEDYKAKKMVEEGAKIAYEQVDSNLHDYVNRTRANSPALYYLETRNWKAAEALDPTPLQNRTIRRSGRKQWPLPTCMTWPSRKMPSPNTTACLN